MFCLDSSLVVAAVSAEAGTTIALQWLGRGENILTNDWLIAEAVAALSQKRRMQLLSAAEHRQVIEALHGQVLAAYRCLPVTRQDFRLAAQFSERAETGLRAGDALHLAIASGADATLVTFDTKQARAGELLQVRTLLL